MSVYVCLITHHPLLLGGRERKPVLSFGGQCQKEPISEETWLIVECENKL